jgi:hypothetical protein
MTSLAFDIEVDEAIDKLLKSLGPAKIVLLSIELEKLVNDPGYGELIIRVHDHRMLVIQVTKTFK